MVGYGSKDIGTNSRVYLWKNNEIIHPNIRSSSKITKFFHNIGLPYIHNGSTRAKWVLDRIK